MKRDHRVYIYKSNASWSFSGYNKGDHGYRLVLTVRRLIWQVEWARGRPHWPLATSRGKKRQQITFYFVRSFIMFLSQDLWLDAMNLSLSFSPRQLLLLYCIVSIWSDLEWNLSLDSFQISLQKDWQFFLAFNQPTSFRFEMVRIQVFVPLASTYSSIRVTKNHIHEASKHSYNFSFFWMVNAATFPK